MAGRKKGVKIKHRKTIYKRRKTKGQKVFSAVLGIVLTAGIMFVGYSVGPPLIDFIRERQNFTNDSSSAVWTPPETTIASTSNTTITEPIDINNPTSDNLNSYYLPTNVLLSEQTLKDAVLSAKNNGFTSVVVTLKAAGGNIYYATENETAKSAKAVVGTLTAPAIAKIITDNNMTPIAEINVFNDNIAPKQNADMAYKFENDSTMWLDNSPANGGKPWLSPFSNLTLTYISDLTNEIAKAGFSKIIASDLIFPPFRNSDLNYIGAVVKDAKRYTILTATVKTMNFANEVDKQIYLKVPALDVLTGKSEVFFPAELEGINLIVEVNPAQIPNKITLKDTTELSLQEMGIYDKVKTILMETSEYAPSSVLLPSIVKTGLSDADYAEVQRALKDLGYNAHLVS